MAKRKLQIPLSAILRRTQPNPPSPALAFASRIPHASTPFAPLTETSRNLLTYSSQLSWKSVLFRNHFASTTLNLRCWNCVVAAETAPFLFCHSCRSVQPVDQSIDYFHIFGLDIEYDIEAGSLEGKYKEWQKKLHPDLVHSKSQREKDYAAEQSARVIDAYRTLNNPLSRAIYMLKLKGLDVDEEQTISEPELLGEIMEIREAVEEAADSQALTEIQIQIQEKLKHWAKSFSNAIRHQDFEEAKISIQRMTYYDRVNKEIVKRL
uniref:J domain-containing protein n=1 Tax=Kalanchoe fedtschenkoi TaxID=63787 RepID=A0A7N0ZRC7_KALFE